ncbi:MAG: hypoxanthine phosphoribosyltransferase [Hyphomicrobiaceae bacterium]
MTDSDVSNIEVIYSPEVINKRVQDLARDIRAAGLENLLVIAILKGSFIFAADLIRALHDAGLSPEVDFITLSSYRKGTKSTGRVEILRDIDMDVTGRNILLVDDILESGRTLAFAKDLLAARGANGISTCVLLKKDVPRSVDIVADFHAFDCPEVFVVGYGMDVSYRYRQLPFVGCITRE